MPLPHAPGTLLCAHDLAFELVDDEVQGSDRGGSRGGRAQDVAVVAQGHLGDLGAVGGVRCVTDELDVGLRHLVRDAVEAPELALDPTAERRVELDVAGLQVRLHVPVLRWVGRSANGSTRHARRPTAVVATKRAVSGR